MWWTCRQVKTIKPLQRMAKGVKWPAESYSPAFTSESMGGAGTARGPLAPSQGLPLRQALTWPSALSGSPSRGCQRTHFPLTACVFSLVPSDPSSFYFRPPSPELAVRPRLHPDPPSTPFSPAQAR